MKKMSAFLFPVLILCNLAAEAYQCGEVYSRGTNHFPVSRIMLMGEGHVVGNPSMACYVAAFETGSAGMMKTRELVVHFCNDKYSYQELTVTQLYNGYRPNVNFIREERELSIISESPFTASGKVILQQQGRSGLAYSSPDSWYRVKVFIDEKSGIASAGADRLASCKFNRVQKRSLFFRE
jgi:hypothetical protein